MSRKFLGLAVVFVVVRIATVLAYRDTLYYYGLVTHQFAIAEAAYKGHWFAQDAVLSGSALREANRLARYIPLEDWVRFPRSGHYSTFPAADLPGFGYLIAFTSRWFGDHLTTRHALVVQVLVELASLLLFVYCVSLAFGARTAGLTGLVYVLGYPFVWPAASQPMRDVFVLGVYASFIAAIFAFMRTRGWLAWILPGALLAVASLLLWVRPHGYYFCVFILPLVLLVRARPISARVALAIMVVLIPWLIFGYPLRLFNLRYYGVAETDAIGRTLWEHMGIVKDNPYGFVLDDEAMVTWVKSYYGKDVEYASPEMNHLLGDYARRVIREDPAFYLKTVALSCLEMVKTPLDLVPPFRLVEYGSSGLSMSEYARAYPGSFAYKILNRLLLALFFYGGLLLALRMARRRKAERLEFAVLMSPLVFTMAVLALTHFESRYMAMGAWVLTLPIAGGIEDMLATRARRGPEKPGGDVECGKMTRA